MHDLLGEDDGKCIFTKLNVTMNTNVVMKVQTKKEETFMKSHNKVKYRVNLIVTK